jgi:tetratricopeptide (TPR) repeat protein
MGKLAMMLVAASLAVLAAPNARPDPLQAAAANDKMEAAKMAEESGDLARIHKDYGLAISSYQAALRLNRHNAVLYDKIGVVHLLEGQRGAARKNFLQAIRYNPTYVAAINNLGVVALLDKKYKIAVNFFKQALALEESNAPIHVNLAEAWVGLELIDRAMTEYARALELDADVLNSSTEGLLAQLSTPEQYARVSYIIAKMYMKRGNIDGALEYLRRAKEENYSEINKVYTDPDFTALWQDPRLAKIVKR